jgi:hypothetical protein
MLTLFKFSASIKTLDVISPSALLDTKLTLRLDAKLLGTIRLDPLEDFDD